jgi:hypothetical protein
MFNFTDRDGNKVPFLKVAIPAWVAFAVNMSLIGYIAYLAAQRPTSPDPAQGFIVGRNLNKQVVYLTQTEAILHVALWGIVFVYMTGVLVYYWRLGIFHRKSD